jgi:hypothetical protein
MSPDKLSTTAKCCLGQIPSLLQAFFEVKNRVASPRQAAGQANPTGNPVFNTQKEVLVMRVVLAVGDERMEFTPG